MKQYLFILAILLPLIYTSCFEEQYNETGKLAFSTDTVMFDTIFSQVGSVTKRFRIYNPNNNDVVISSISLAKGTDSEFRLNIDGEATNHARNIRVRGKDSLYIFVELTINPGGGNSPMVVEDSIIFNTNGHRQDVNLLAWGQDVHLFIARTLKTQTWTNEKPYLIYFNVLVDSLETLTIEKGTRVHFHKNASMVVKGNLVVKGTLDEPVVFQGDRLDDLFPGFPYDDVPGQWGAIAFLDGSEGNEMNYAIVKNATAGIQLGEHNKYSGPDLTLKNTIIQNSSFAGIFAFGGNITAHNSIIANSGHYNLFLSRGGNMEFYHCTIANYWKNFSNRSTPSVYISNYYYSKYYDVEKEDTIEEYFEQDLEKSYFGNTIIYGNLKNELLFDDTSGVAFSPEFDYCLLKVPENYEKPEEVLFHESITEVSDSLFISPDEFNYELDTLTEAQDAGDISIARKYPTDYNGNRRLSDKGPDLGAYERIE